MPYIAWLYALAAQADPSTTPDLFWELAMGTGAHNPDQARRKRYPPGPIVDPVALIAALQKR
jgi:hypothetical protein